MESSQRTGLRFSSGAFIHFPNPRGQLEVTVNAADPTCLPEGVDVAMVFTNHLITLNVSLLVALVSSGVMFTYRSTILLWPLFVTRRPSG